MAQDLLARFYNFNWNLPNVPQGDVGAVRAQLRQRQQDLEFIECLQRFRGRPGSHPDYRAHLRMLREELRAFREQVRMVLRAAHLAAEARKRRRSFFRRHSFFYKQVRPLAAMRRRPNF
eukprot:2468003-Heterocapsa_arctica.AAC.1